MFVDDAGDVEGPVAFAARNLPFTMDWKRNHKTVRGFMTAHASLLRFCILFFPLFLGVISREKGTT